MPRIIDYPRASLKSSLKLAEAVQDLGGDCAVEMAADRMGKRVGGSFKALMSAATKYALLSHKSGRLTVTALYREYRLAYTADERDGILQKAFLSVKLFTAIFERFKAQKLPMEHFEKLLVREFEVPEEIASRVVLYFVDGAKQTSLLNPDHTFAKAGAADAKAKETEAATIDDEEEESSNGNPLSQSESPGLSQALLGGHEGYSVRIVGPGMDSIVAIKDEDDISIVEVMLNKVKRKLKEQVQPEIHSPTS